jgi:hypothetical protein
MDETQINVPLIEVTPDPSPEEELLLASQGNALQGEPGNVEVGGSIDDFSTPLENMPSSTSWESRSASDQAEIEALSALSDPTMSDKAREMAFGTAIGSIEGGAMMGTGLAGARTAASLMPVPQLKPVAGLVGFAGGVTAGFLATHNIDQLFPEVSRTDLIPYREGGKTFGASIAAAPVAFGIPAMNANIVARYLSIIGDSARRNPKSFLAAEMLAGAGAGVAGGASEAYYPGETGVRVGAEILGGFFSPGRLVAVHMGSVVDFAKALKSSVSPASREARAANALVKVLEETGADVPRLVKELQKITPAGVTPSAAQKTGDEALTMLETTLARGNAKYGAEILKQGQDSIRAYELLINKLRDIGTPEALVKAAELRDIKLNGLLEGRMAIANADAAEKIAKITKDTPQARGEIGNIVRTETERALADARQHEKFLWDAAYKGSLRTKQVKGEKVLALKEVSPANLGESFLEIATSMTPERLAAMPPAMRSIMSRLGVNDEALKKYAAGKLTPEYLETGKVPSSFLTKTVGKKEVPVIKKTDIQDLINIRSDFLAFSREAAARGEVANSGFYGRMAEAVLDDLSSAKNPAYNEARQFSRVLNNYFTRSYANEVSAVTKKGADKLPPEILVQRAFGSANDTTALRMADIEDAVGMMGKQYDDAVSSFGLNSPQAQALQPYADVSKDAVVSIRDAQSRAYRLAAAKSIDPVTGRVNPRQLTQFVAENKTVLDRLNITNDLQDALKAENIFRGIQDQNSFINTSINKQAAFARVLAFENPTTAITDALNKSRYPVRNFKGIVRLAKSGGDEAVDGLKASLYDYAFTKAGGETNFSPAAFDKALFQPIAPGQPSIFNILRSADAISITETKNLRRLIQPMERIESALKNNQLTNEVVTGADAVTELALRVMGAKLGASLSPGSSGSLIAASAGSKFMRKTFDKMPTFLVRGVIEEATKDPQMMALLLQRGVTERDKFRLSRQLHSYLGAAGLTYAEADNDPMPPEETSPRPGPGRQARRLMQNFPTAPTRGAPTPYGPSAPPAPAPQGGMEEEQAQPSTSRRMFQRLFPTDSASSMME